MVDVGDQRCFCLCSHEVAAVLLGPDEPTVEFGIGIGGCQVGIDDVGHLPRTKRLNVIPPDLQAGLGTPFLPPAPVWARQQPVTPNAEANLWAFDDTLKNPHSYLVDVSIGRELPRRFSVQFSYVGRFGGHLLTQRDLNQPLDIVDPQSKIDY